MTDRNCPLCTGPDWPHWQGKIVEPPRDPLRGIAGFQQAVKSVYEECAALAEDVAAGRDAEVIAAAIRARSIQFEHEECAELAKPEPVPVALASYSYCTGDDYSVEGPHLALYRLDQRSDAQFNAMRYPNGIDRPKAGFVCVLFRKEDL